MNHSALRTTAHFSIEHWKIIQDYIGKCAVVRCVRCGRQANRTPPWGRVCLGTFRFEITAPIARRPFCALAEKTPKLRTAE